MKRNHDNYDLFFYLLPVPEPLHYPLAKKNSMNQVLPEQLSQTLSLIL